jgi:soluble lytic murein transglycosylase
MHKKVIPIIHKIFLLSILSLSGTQSMAMIEPTDHYRDSFLRVEELIKKGNKDLFLGELSELSGYPLYPYLMYQWLGNNLQNTAEIQAFLSNFPESRHSELLRNDWLEHLAKRQAWQEITEFYQDNGNIAAQCRYYWALYNTKKKQKALYGMTKIWPVAEQLPKSCHSLKKVFVKSNFLTTEMKWRKFELGLKQRNTLLANQVLNLFAKQDKSLATLWLRVHNNPTLIANIKHSQKRDNKKIASIFAYGVERLARKKLASAIKIWDARRDDFDLTKLRKQEVEKELAIWMVIRRDKSAYNRFNALIFTDQEIREWRVRAALLENNWAHVISALNRLNNLEKIRPKWQYWRARAYWETGGEKLAKKIFSDLADKRNFYGFVAADYIGQDYQLTNKKIKLPQFKLTNFVQNKEFKAVQEFKYFNRDVEARKQWLSALEILPEWQVPAAAFLAQEQGWDQLATETIKLAGYKQDIGLRFSMAYRNQVMKHAKQRKIDPSIVFSIIRRESAFNKNAVSPVGARGLMQIMPETGKFIAKKLKETWRTVEMLFDTETNLRFGTYYYKRMLDRFNGNFALAAAAYNAGPHRVNKWLPNKQNLPADIWIEMIPFDETRKYVVAVLTNALIYQDRLKRNSLKITDMLKDIRPRKI